MDLVNILKRQTLLKDSLWLVLEMNFSVKHSVVFRSNYGSTKECWAVKVYLGSANSVEVLSEQMETLKNIDPCYGS